ncbi:MAG: ribonuclease HII [Candidatus Hydrogenedentes bacterium]|nr:ribonuclease HII [Candidatus Hydrogenedentota bacterium]
MPGTPNSGERPDEDVRLEAMLCFERDAAARGFQCVAGVDEAGRGPLAGPIVAGAVVLREPIPGLNDSKLLTEAQREDLFRRLQDGGHAIGCAIVSAEEIDALGIQSANYAAMLRAVAALTPQPDFLLVDGFSIPGCTTPHLRLVKGDRRSLSIAAASIIAKVTRDRLMIELDGRCPGYGFARHKGYATPEHLEALKRLGPCPAHRRSFAPLATTLETASLFDPSIT